GSCPGTKARSTRPAGQGCGWRRPAGSSWPMALACSASPPPIASSSISLRLPVAVIVGREAFVLDFDHVAPAVRLRRVRVGEAVAQLRERCESTGQAIV